ncbi:MurR/RpiR family transcriptional regulator [Cetobacterium sp.]|uniref:MurR/RpiR family transcriptional regulator n=2 Tax=Cetobacterium sp. TaxID=2071632 RepID=UPI003F3A60F4
MFFLKVDGIEDELTKSEKKLVQYIKENLVLVKKYNVMDLADKSGVSAPSIIRLAKKLGYTGFLDMKIDLNKNRSFSDEDNTFFDKLMIAAKENIYSLPPTVTFENILIIAKYLKNSNKIFLLLEDDFFNLERFLYQKLLLGGKNAIKSLNNESNFKILEKFEKDDVIFILAKNLSEENLKLLERFKTNGLNYIFIGENLKTESRNILDVDLDLNIDISENLFMYVFLLEGILKFI